MSRLVCYDFISASDYPFLIDSVSPDSILFLKKHYKHICAFSPKDLDFQNFINSQELMEEDQFNFCDVRRSGE